MHNETNLLRQAGTLREKVKVYSHRGGERFWELDFLRGLCVLLMIFDHFMFCIWGVMPMVNEILGTSVLESAAAFAERYWDSAFRHTARFLVLCVFFGLCGVSCTLSKNNFKRALPIAGLAVFINIASAVIEEYFGGGMTVVFGVLHMLSASVLIFALLDLLVTALVRAFGIGETGESVLRFLRARSAWCSPRCIFPCGASFPAVNGWQVVGTVSASGDRLKDMILGIFVEMPQSPYLMHADYFPLLPWGAFVLIGSLFGRGIYHTYAKNALKRLNGPWNAGFCFLGRHAALFYLGHMAAVPAVLVFFALVSMIF